MTIKSDRDHLVELTVRAAAVRTSPTAAGAVRLSDPRLYVDRTAIQLEARSRHGLYHWRIPFARVLEAKSDGEGGVFLRLRSGEMLVLDIAAHDQWMRLAEPLFARLKLVAESPAPI